MQHGWKTRAATLLLVLCVLFTGAASSAAVAVPVAEEKPAPVNEIQPAEPAADAAPVAEVKSEIATEPVPVIAPDESEATDVSSESQPAPQPLSS